MGIPGFDIDYATIHEHSPQVIGKAAGVLLHYIENVDDNQTRESESAYELLGIIAEAPTTPPSTLATLAENIHVQMSVFHNPAATGNLIHDIVTHYFPASDDIVFHYDYFAASHGNTLNATLEYIANTISRYTPEELLEHETCFDYQIEGFVTVQVLVAVMLHKRTYARTRAALWRLLEQALDLAVAAGQLNDIRECLANAVRSHDAANPQTVTRFEQLLERPAYAR